MCQRLPAWICLVLQLGGCSSLRLPGERTAGFPPQRVMENGNYTAFIEENQRVLQRCPGSSGCDAALFNLGFAFAYHLSPHRDLAKSLRYFGQLVKEYPRSPLAYQGQAWMAFINEQVSLERERDGLEKDLRAHRLTIRQLRANLQRSREIDVEIERKERELLR